MYENNEKDELIAQFALDLDAAQQKVLTLEAEVAERDRTIATLRATGQSERARIQEWLTDTLGGYAASKEEFAEEFETLIDISGFELIETKTFTVRIEVEVEVEVPFGDDVSEYDFWVDDLSLSSNYEINRQDSCDITDVSEN